MFDSRQRPSAASVAPPAMCHQNPSWILVEGCLPATIQNATIEHSGLCGHELPTRHRVTLLQLGRNHYGLVFDPPIPPYAFTNLVSWLGDPNMAEGSRGAMGWFVSPGSGTRYFFASAASNPGGDTLSGVAHDGTLVSLYLPDGALSAGVIPVVAIPEFPLGPASPIGEFGITVDSNRGFGNPDFVLGG